MHEFSYDGACLYFFFIILVSESSKIFAITSQWVLSVFSPDCHLGHIFDVFKILIGMEVWARSSTEGGVDSN